MRCLIVSLMFVMTSSISLAAPVTPGDAQADFANGQYRPCLQKIASVMTNSSLSPEQKYDMFKLRGECMLQLRSNSLASDAFHSAALVSKGAGKMTAYAEAESICILIKASPGLGYTPAKPPDAKPISIVAPEQRKAAMMALLDDRMAEFEPKIAAARQGTSLTPMIALVPAITDMYTLEMGATGATTRTIELGKSLGARARELISPELQRISARVQSLDSLASSPNLVAAGGIDTISYRGLYTPEREELHDLADQLVKIQQVAQNARRLAQQMGGTPDAWDSILAECNEIRQTAQQAYDRRY